MTTAHTPREPDEPAYTPSAEFAVTQEILTAQLAESRADARRALDNLSDIASDDQVRDATGFDLASWRAEIDSVDED